MPTESAFAGLGNSFYGQYFGVDTQSKPTRQCTTPEDFDLDSTTMWMQGFKPWFTPATAMKAWWQLLDSQSEKILGGVSLASFVCRNFTEFFNVFFADGITDSIQATG